MEKEKEAWIEFCVSVHTYDMEPDQSVDAYFCGKVNTSVEDPLALNSEHCMKFRIEPGEVIDGVHIPKVTGSYSTKESATEETTAYDDRE